jgi:hypothetical protein
MPDSLTGPFLFCRELPLGFLSVFRIVVGAVGWRILNFKRFKWHGHRDQLHQWAGCKNFQHDSATLSRVESAMLGVRMIGKFHFWEKPSPRWTR